MGSQGEEVGVPQWIVGGWVWCGLRPPRAFRGGGKRYGDRGGQRHLKSRPERTMKSGNGKGPTSGGERKRPRVISVVENSRVRGSSIAWGESACSQGTLHPITEEMRHWQWDRPELGSRLQNLRRSKIMFAKKAHKTDLCVRTTSMKLFQGGGFCLHRWHGCHVHDVCVRLRCGDHLCRREISKIMDRVHERVGGFRTWGP